MGAVAVHKLTVEEYLAVDREAELKSEYYDGELFPMAAVSWEHAQLCVGISRRLAEITDKKPCRVGVAPMRVRVSASKFVYPDVVVVCGRPSFTDERLDTITNPQVVVEVLSPSTANFDRGDKFELYRDLPSLQDYVLVSQSVERIEVYHRTPEGDWLLRIYDGPAAAVQFTSLGASVRLSEIYGDILAAARE